MSLPGRERELIERHEKLCGVVLQCGKSKPHFVCVCDGEEVRPNRLKRTPLITANPELHIWPQLTKDNVKRSNLNFNEDD